MCPNAARICHRLTNLTTTLLFLRVDVVGRVDVVATAMFWFLHRSFSSVVVARLPQSVGRSQFAESGMSELVFLKTSGANVYQ